MLLSNGSSEAPLHGLNAITTGNEQQLQPESHTLRLEGGFHSGFDAIASFLNKADVLFSTKLMVQCMLPSLSRFAAIYGESLTTEPAARKNHSDLGMHNSLSCAWASYTMSSHQATCMKLVL